MQWFKHDADAATDAKIKKLVMRYGTDGYAIYFHCIELIVGNISEQNITFELEHDAEIIADNLKIQGTTAIAPVDRVNEIMRYIVSLGLFEETNGHIYCYKILKRLDSSMTSNVGMRKIIGEAKKSHDTVMTPSCQSHDGVMINHDTVMLEEKRRDKEKKRREEDAPDEPSPPSSASPIQKRNVHTPNDATTRIDRLRTAWNYLELPECRYTVLNFRDFERTDCMRAISFYTDAEIEKAMQNYAGILKSSAHEIFPYKGFTTFMAKGVEQYIDTAGPWTAKKRRATDTEKKKADENKERGGFEAPVSTCKCCGNTWKSTMSTCPRCHYDEGDIEEHKQWYFDRFGERLPETV